MFNKSLMIRKIADDFCEVLEDGVVVLDAIHQDSVKYMKDRLDGVDHITAAERVTEAWRVRAGV